MDAEAVRSGDLIAVGPEPIEEMRLESVIQDASAGANVLFYGTVRDHSGDREGVTHLEYEAYQDVVEDKIAEIVDESRRKWPAALRIAAVHRTGSVDVGQASVCVAVSAPHRPDAFAAAAYLIDELKKRVPIWKKEYWPGGAEWVREGEVD